MEMFTYGMDPVLVYLENCLQMMMAMLIADRFNSLEQGSHSLNAISINFIEYHYYFD